VRPSFGGVDSPKTGAYPSLVLQSPLAKAGFCVSYAFVLSANLLALSNGAKTRLPVVDE